MLLLLLLLLLLLAFFVVVTRERDRDRESNNFIVYFCFVHKMYFSLPQLCVMFDVLSVAVFVIKDRFVKSLFVKS